MSSRRTATDCRRFCLDVFTLNSASREHKKNEEVGQHTTHVGAERVLKHSSTMPPLIYQDEASESNTRRCRTPLHDESSASESFDDAHPDLINLKSHAEGTQRRARFSESVTCHLTLTRSEYSEEESKNCWYSASEYASFRQDVCTTVYLMQIDPNRVDGVDFTMRGVEHRVAEVSLQRRRLRSLSISAVLDEQSFQRGIGESSQDEIAKLYARHCEHAVLEAINLAAWNKLDAEQSQSDIAEDDFFADDWISSVSSTASAEKNCVIPWEESELLDNVSGFDDSWLRDVAVSS